jgi:hypothetical protein
MVLWKSRYITINTPIDLSPIAKVPRVHMKLQRKKLIDYIMKDLMQKIIQDI